MKKNITKYKIKFFKKIKKLLFYFIKVNREYINFIKKIFGRLHNQKI